MFSFWFDATMLSIEAQRVINLRMMTARVGGTKAQTEARRMVNEKMFASMGAAVSLMHGGSSDAVLAHYRKRVRANARRLSRK